MKITVPLTEQMRMGSNSTSLRLLYSRSSADLPGESSSLPGDERFDISTKRLKQKF